MVDKHPLQALCEQSDLNVMSYSGRGMYGKTCLGIDCDNVKQVFAALLESIYVAGRGSDLDIAAIGAAVKRMQTDSLGMGTVVYFPGVPFVGDEEENDNDPER